MKCYLTLLEIISTWSNIKFQELSSQQAIQSILTYEVCITVLFFVLNFVIIFLVAIILSKFSRAKFTNNHKIELIWSSMPVLLLIIIATPSLHSLYINRKDFSYCPKLKIVGSQWKWEYFFTNKTSNFDKNTADHIKKNNLDNTKNVVTQIISSKNINILLTREDVIHSWALPRAGIKIDAIPGKLREQFIKFNRVGYFFGNCTEVCGPFHRIIPIKILVKYINFTNYSCNL